MPSSPSAAQAGWKGCLGIVVLSRTETEGRTTHPSRLEPPLVSHLSTQGHLTDDGIDLENMDFISRERFDLLSNGKIRKGDILFCLRGSLGKFASVGDLSEGAIASSLVIVRPEHTVLNAFVWAFLRSSLCSAMINRFKNGAAQPNLSAQSLGKFIVPVPPLPVQESVVKKLMELRTENPASRIHLRAKAHRDGGVEKVTTASSLRRRTVEIR